MKPVRFLLALALIAGLSLGVVGCQSDKGVAARVNGDEVSLIELNAQIDQLKKQYPNMFTGADGEGRLLDFKQRILDNLINRKLVEQAAKDNGVEVTDADVEKQLATLKKGFTDDAQFQQALKSANLDEAGLKQQIRESLVQTKLIDKLSSGTKKVTADEIKAYYDANKAQFEQAAAKRASHILFKPEDQATAEKVLAEIKAGGDFAAAAKKYSQDPGSAQNGGDLSWPTTPYVPEFQAALDKLKVGETTAALVKTSLGWHIIRVTDQREAKTRTLDEAKAQIEQIIQQQRKADAFQKYIDAARKKAKIEILLPELRAKTGSTETTTSK